MNNATMQRSLTVSQRLWTLGVAALFGVGSVLGVSWYAHDRTDAALADANALQQRVDRIDAMHTAMLTIRLAAMDTIIDHADGLIQPERLQALTTSIALLNQYRQDAEQLAMEAASTRLSGLGEKLAQLQQLSLVELKQAVEKGAPKETFDALDDKIDELGGAVTERLREVRESGTRLAAAKIARANDMSRLALNVQILLGLVAMAAMALLQFIHGGSIRRGIETLRASMLRIVDGDLDVAVPETQRGDEIGEMARAAERFRVAAIEKKDLEALSESERQRNEEASIARSRERKAEREALDAAVDALADGLNRLAAGDVGVTIHDPFTPTLERLRRDFNQTTERLRQAMNEIGHNSQSIHANSRQMRSAADDLAKRTEQQAASLEETSAALGQITGIVRDNAGRAEQVGKMVADTRDSTARSDVIVNDAMSAMARIEAASQEIGTIINVIDEIAFQTNLLALNAGVEAARAGEAGKGFAVVAQEVRELAGRAANAAKTIKDLIARSGAEVKTGGELVTAAGEALKRIGEDVLKIDDLVKSIVTSAREQSVGLNEINVAISQMDQMTQKNAAMVEETNAASHTLAGDAEGLIQLVQRFKTGEGMTSPSMPREADKGSHATQSPARQLMTRLAGALSSGSAKTAGAAPATEHWEEF